jgi:hypothetical protein
LFRPCGAVSPRESTEARLALVQGVHGIADLTSGKIVLRDSVGSPRAWNARSDSIRGPAELARVFAAPSVLSESTAHT